MTISREKQKWEVLLQRQLEDAKALSESEKKRADSEEARRKDEEERRKAADRLRRISIAQRWRLRPPGSPYVVRTSAERPGAAGVPVQQRCWW